MIPGSSILLATFLSHYDEEGLFFDQCIVITKYHRRGL